VTTDLVPVLEIGGTHVSAALVDPSDWSVHDAHRRHVETQGSADEIIGAIVAAGAALDAPQQAVWGVAMPDPFDYDNGIATFRDVGKFESLYGVDVGAALRDRLPQRPSHIVFRNDADLFVLGEWVHGSARGTSRCVGITLGTGLGTGWIVDGRIVLDEPGVPELGRARTVFYQGESLEEFVSSRGVRRAYGDANADVAQIAALAGSGDERSLRAFADVGTALGAGLGANLREFRPDVIVLGGSIAKSWSLLEPSFREGLGWPDAPPVVLADHPDSAPLRGAAQVTLTAPR
jgi:glucokinase